MFLTRHRCVGRSGSTLTCDGGKHLDAGAPGVTTSAKWSASGHDVALKLALDADEDEIEPCRANRLQGFRVVVGHVVLTKRRLLFVPHKFDRATGGRRWECALASVEGVRMSAAGATRSTVRWDGVSRSIAAIRRSTSS